MRAHFEILRGNWTELQALCEKAAGIATGLGPDRLIDIAQSEDNKEMVLTVWSWDRVVSMDRPTKKARFQIFRSLHSRTALFSEVGQFVTEVGPDRLICLSQS